MPGTAVGEGCQLADVRSSRPAGDLESEPMNTRQTPDPAVQRELTRLRESIDNIDAAVVHLLAERFKCTQQVGELKAAHQLPPADPEREARQIHRLRQLAVSAKLDPAFAEKLLNFIIAEVIRHHETLADQAERTASTPEAASEDPEAPRER